MNGNSSLKMIATLTIFAWLAFVSAAVAQQETLLYSFGSGSTDASSPFAALISDAAGNFYGTTAGGGDFGVGTVFELSPNSSGGWTETVLHSFGSGSDGSFPQSALVMNSSGRLYGTTTIGGSSNMGTIFALAYTKTGGWKEKVLHNFSGPDGERPYAGLTLDQAGNLYGTCEQGGAYGDGTVFELTATSAGFGPLKTLHNFNDNGHDGWGPYASMVFDSAGNLYGTTLDGGTGQNGTVFELSPTASGPWKEKILHNFVGGDGQVPVSTLIFDPAGNIYGATRWGGVGLNTAGTVFELSPTTSGGWKESVLHTFGSGSDGQNPEAGVIMDSAGNLYGTTEVGGTNSNGIVYELTPAGDGSWTETILHNFNATDFEDGGYPWSGLLFNSAGNLVGNTSAGGTHGTGGMVFEIAP